MFPPLIRPSFSQIRGRGWNNIVLTNWLHFPGTCSQNSPKQRSLQKFRESFDIDFWLQVLLVVPLHQRMDLGGLGDQDHCSFGADVWWIRKGHVFYFEDLGPKEYVALNNDLWRDGTSNLQEGKTCPLNGNSFGFCWDTFPRQNRQ